MSIITWPSNLVPGAITGWGQRRYDLTYESDITGARQDILLGPPRWVLSVQQPEVLNLEDAGEWHALLVKLRGRVNHLLAWDFGRPVPLGSMRGTMALGAQANSGATQLQIITNATQASKTLLPGDKLQLGTGLGTSQLVMVVDTATANGSGAITVNIEPALRMVFPVSTAVTWDKASAYFKVETASNSWRYGVGGLFASGVTLDLIEVWT
jgi:hypothetical protein